MGGGKETGEIFDIEAGHKSERRLGLEVIGESHTHHRGSRPKICGFAEEQKGRLSGFDFHQRHAAAGIPPENFGRIGSAAGFHRRLFGLTDHGVGRQNGALVIDEKAGSGQLLRPVGGTDADHRRGGLLVNPADLRGDFVKNS